MRLGRETTAARRKASRLAGLAGRCPAPYTAPIGRGAIRTTCSLAGVLPPWHDRCHGSPVLCGILSVGRYKPPPHGLRYSTPRRVLVGKQLICGVTAARQRASWLAQGVVPLDPGLRAFGAQGYRETRGLASFYRRSATGLAARESGVVSLSVKAKRPHSATGLMVRNQNPACFQNRLDFFVTKQPKPCRSLSPHAISAPLPPKRRRSSAAIGSGGKKARSF